MRFNNAATERLSDKATKGGADRVLRLPLRRSVAPSLRRSPPTAFTLVEIMIAVVIVGLLAGIVSYSYSAYLDRAKRVKARADIATIVGALDAYYGINSRLPDNQDGLKVLVPGFIKSLPKDPWGHDYFYVQPGKAAPYDLISYGADGREGGSGADADITSNDVEMKEGVKGK